MSAAVTVDTTICAACGIEQCRHFDGWDGSPLGCAETSRRWGGHFVEGPAPAPVPTRRRYTFAVYLEVPEPVHEDDIDGYTREDVEAIITRTLASYASPLHGREFRTVGVDWELMDSEAVEPAAARR
jgi:hypothetical protein